MRVRQLRWKGKERAPSNLKSDNRYLHFGLLPWSVHLHMWSVMKENENLEQTGEEVMPRSYRNEGMLPP